MVENSNHCVLEWAGHAGYVAERFSGLLARQAFVDVTLICEDQKLRVHKLVLASNSTYFEVRLYDDIVRGYIFCSICFVPFLSFITFFFISFYNCNK